MYKIFRRGYVSEGDKFNKSPRLMAERPHYTNRDMVPEYCGHDDENILINLPITFPCTSRADETRAAGSSSDNLTEAKFAINLHLSDKR